jgi:hypothetical protein
MCIARCALGDIVEPEGELSDITPCKIVDTLQQLGACLLAPRSNRLQSPAQGREIFALFLEEQVLQTVDCLMSHGAAPFPSAA